MIEKLERNIRVINSDCDYAISSPPTNEQIISKINEIIDYLNKTGHKSYDEIMEILTRPPT